MTKILVPTGISSGAERADRILAYKHEIAARLYSLKDTDAKFDSRLKRYQEAEKIATRLTDEPNHLKAAYDIALEYGTSVVNSAVHPILELFGINLKEATKLPTKDASLQLKPLVDAELTRLSEVVTASTALETLINAKPPGVSDAELKLFFDGDGTPANPGLKKLYAEFKSKTNYEHEAIAKLITQYDAEKSDPTKLAGIKTTADALSVTEISSKKKQFGDLHTAFASLNTGFFDDSSKVGTATLSADQAKLLLLLGEGGKLTDAQKALLADIRKYSGHEIDVPDAQRPQETMPVLDATQQKAVTDALTADSKLTGKDFTGLFTSEGKLDKAKLKALHDSFNDEEKTALATVLKDKLPDDVKSKIFKDGNFDFTEPPGNDNGGNKTTLWTWVALAFGGISALAAGYLYSLYNTLKNTVGLMPQNIVTQLGQALPDVIRQSNQGVLAQVNAMIDDVAGSLANIGRGQNKAIQQIQGYVTARSKGEEHEVKANASSDDANVGPEQTPPPPNEADATGGTAKPAGKPSGRDALKQVEKEAANLALPPEKLAAQRGSSGQQGLTAGMIPLQPGQNPLNASVNGAPQGFVPPGPIIRSYTGEGNGAPNQTKIVYKMDDNWGDDKNQH